MICATTPASVCGLNDAWRKKKLKFCLIENSDTVKYVMDVVRD